MNDRKQRAAQAGHMGYGSRLKEQPADELLQSAFAHEVGDGALLYRGMSLADLAYCIMLCECGLIPQQARQPLMRGLLELHAIPAEQFPFDPIYGDIYTNREQALRERVPEHGADGWLRLGRARRESSTVGYLITSRTYLLRLIEAHAALIGTLLRLAAGHRHTLMPDYTYLQKAHPTTLAHYLLTFAAPLLRDAERLRAAYGRLNQSPLGSGSVNGSRLPLNRERAAELLGFEGVAAHTRDAMWQADVAIEVAAELVILMTTLDRLAEDLYLFATEEFGYLRLADAHSRTSVIMPQKKNPYSLAYVRGAARASGAALYTIIATNQTPSGQPDNRIFAYGELPRALDRGTRTVRLLTGVLDRAEWQVERMAARAAEGFSGATDLGDYLSEAANLDPRTAHRLIGYAVRAALEAGLPSDQPLTSAALDQAAQALLGRALNLPEEAVRQAQAPQAIVASRRGLGGASPESVTALLDEYQVRLQAYQWWADQEQVRLEMVEQTLLTLARAIAEG
ncbi:MAG: argininosuccinate lyase [Candidatus Thermofonsia Clade 1 bacterium]|jgi:argininosuccinate lyase|uniref:argininosuccinate lyase n=1 Tax=Candidatus Thermofonsia Clade 1 bacterium TaxID=2364210 RepID=A0A2M8PG79_9CHLR|nr:MAG: argininosuccinate lyase [Candidatus Thermofonsia Clade 1 bacterium]RMF51053.1 MAG: argininosuccinate lyase [Chloroflexota bacterium]